MQAKVKLMKLDETAKQTREQKSSREFSKRASWSVISSTSTLMSDSQSQYCADKKEGDETYD